MVKSVFKKYLTLLSIFALIASFGVAMIPRQTEAAIVTKKARIYGDSLMYESKSYVTSSLPKSTGWTGIVTALPGRAPCDFVPKIQNAFTKNLPTDLVVIETAGNSATACMKDPATKKFMTIGSQAWINKYRTDMNKIFKMVTDRGLKVIFVVNPPVASETYWLGDRENGLNNLLPLIVADAANYHGVSISYGPRAAVTDSNGAIAYQLPCLANETAVQGCVNGMITVRDGIGLHFCPLGFDQSYPKACAVYSSGAVRFGKAIAEAIKNPLAPINP